VIGASEQNLRRILEANADGIVIVDGEGMVSYANPAAEALFGRRPGELVGSEFGFPLVLGETTEVDLVRPDMQGNGEAAAPAVAEIRTVPIEWEGKRACLASLRDITERKRAAEEHARWLSAEAARAEAEAAVRARDEFLAVLAHELKTPLTRVLLAVERSVRTPSGSGTAANGGGDGGSAARRPGTSSPVDAEQVRRLLASVGEECRQLSRLVDRVFSMVSLQAGTMMLRRAPVDVRQLVENVVAAAAAETRRHEVVARLPDAPLVAAVDEQKLAQVVTQLLENAVRYSYDGGLVEVELWEDRTAQQVCLAVRDHGVGIPPEHRPHIFDCYYQAHRGTYLSGIGVGLYVCRGIVELHGGRIEATFPEDGGSRFEVRLPLQTASER